MSQRKLLFGRIAVLTLRGPNSHAASTRRIPAKGRPSIDKRVAEAIQTFARGRGISPLAVDYDIAWETAQ